MNKILLSIVSILVLVVGYLLLDSEEISRVDSSRAEVITKKDESPTQSVKIEYQVTKTETKDEPKTIDKPKSMVEGSKVHKIITENSLVPIKSNGTGEEVRFKDNTGRYEANILVNTSSFRDDKMFPQIPILASFVMPSGEVIKAQIDPTLATDKSFLKVNDVQTGEEYIFDVSGLSNYRSADDVKFDLFSDGSSNNLNMTKQMGGILPPIPPMK
jgi:hypothetical protein